MFTHDQMDRLAKIPANYLAQRIKESLYMMLDVEPEKVVTWCERRMRYERAEAGFAKAKAALDTANERCTALLDEMDRCRVAFQAGIPGQRGKLMKAWDDAAAKAEAAREERERCFRAWRRASTALVNSGKRLSDDL